jgi:hypothetical protein
MTEYRLCISLTTAHAFDRGMGILRDFHRGTGILPVTSRPV